MDIGERIRILRTDMDMTQEELAEEANTTKQNIYKYEKGIITNIPSDKIEKIAEALDTTPAYLMGWVDYDDSREHCGPSEYLADYLRHIGIEIYASIRDDELEVVQNRKHYFMPAREYEELQKQIQQFAEFLFTKALSKCPISPESDRTVWEIKEVYNETEKQNNLADIEQNQEE